MKFRESNKTLLCLSLAVGLSACGGSSDPAPVRISASLDVLPGHSICQLGGTITHSGLDTNHNNTLEDSEISDTSSACNSEQDLASAEHPWLITNNLKSGINIDSPTTYSLYLPEGSESLVIYLASGAAGENLGDPDLYVKYDGSPTAEAGVDDGLNDCISYNGENYNEVCIIDDAKAGTYEVLIQANGQVTDADLYATTELFVASHACNAEINLRAQAMTYEEAAAACDELANTKTIFEQVLGVEVHPEPGTHVEGDLNQSTNLHVFASLSNHMSWAEHLWETDNSSGIYFETSPKDWWHSSDILTFNGIEWSGGLPVVRSLSHEYIHALDGRYNKEGGYRYDIGWWSEGLAEYLSTHYKLPYQRVVHGHSGAPYTLSQIFNRQDSVDVYSWGELAVAFLLEKRPDQTKQLLTHMRAGEWDELKTLLTSIAQASQQDFEAFYQQEVVQQFRDSGKALAVGDFTQIEGRGGWLYKVEIPAGTASVTFSTQGGSGNVDLWVHSSAFHPNIDQNAMCSSVTNGNTENCTVSNPQAGTYYITVGSDFSGADIVDLYLSACSGVDCSVTLPSAKETIQVTQPYLPHWPEKGQFGGCTLEETYGRDTLSYAPEFKVTNNSDKDVNLHWISNYNGTAGGSFDTLSPGGEYVSEYWRVGDRLMLTDAASNCIAVAISNDSANAFEIDNDLVANAATEKPEPVAGTLGSCNELLTPYSRTSESAVVNVINNSSKVIDLHWVATSTGEANTGNNYGPLNNGENYAADYWVVGDRMAVYSEGACVGVIDLTANDMVFEITDENF